MEIKYRLLILVLMVLVCSGCSATYNLNIDKDGIAESIVVNDEVNSDRTVDDVLSVYNAWYPVYPVEFSEFDYSYKLEGASYYDKSYSNDGNKYIMNYSYKHELSKYYNSFLVNSGFNKYNISIDNDTILLDLDSKNNFIHYYPEFTNFTINIVTELKVSENNADIVVGNKYTWYYNRANNDSKKLKMKILLNDSKNDVSSVEEDSNNKNDLIKKDNRFYIFGIIIGIVLYLVVILLIAKKGKK